jgi:hypothetical protein
MHVEQTISEIESLERIFAVPDTRPSNSNDSTAANQKHDEANAHSPWFSLPDYGRIARYTGRNRDPQAINSGLPGESRDHFHAAPQLFGTFFENILCDRQG